MIHSRQLQATHCYEPPSLEGIWRHRKRRGGYVHAPTLSSAALRVRLVWPRSEDRTRPAVEGELGIRGSTEALPRQAAEPQKGASPKAKAPPSAVTIQ